MAGNPLSFFNIDRPETQFPDDVDTYDGRVYDKARELLDNPNLKVYEVGQIVGYYSPKHFSKVFKKHTNMTPNEYRDRNKHV